MPHPTHLGGAAAAAGRAAEVDPYGILGPLAAAGVCDQAALAELLAAAALGEASGEGGGGVGGGLGGGGGAAPASARGDHLARPGDACSECGCALLISGMAYECPSCHALFEPADIQDVIPACSSSEGPCAPPRGRLRIVGPESGWYQPDIDRTSPGETAEQQIKATYTELLHYNRDFESRGGGPIPLNVLREVAEKYQIIQQHCVKRSMMKKVIYAALIVHICASKGFGFTRTPAEAAEFAKLPSHGIARGDDFIRSIDEDKGLGIDLNEDLLRPHLCTAFVNLNLNEKRYEPLKEAAAAIVRVAVASNIGFRSMMRSKALAATAEVLRRKGLMGGQPETIVSAKCNITVHTMRCFLEQLVLYHSYFEEIYRAYGLDASRR